MLLDRLYARVPLAAMARFLLIQFRDLTIATKLEWCGIVHEPWTGTFFGRFGRKRCLPPSCTKKMGSGALALMAARKYDVEDRSRGTGSFFGPFWPKKVPVPFQLTVTRQHYPVV